MESFLGTLVGYMIGALVGFVLIHYYFNTPKWVNKFWKQKEYRE